MRSRLREDEEDDEEDDAQRRRNTTQVMAEAAGWLATNPLQQQPQWGGSVRGRATCHRSHEVANEKLLNDYFVADPVYPAEIFRRRYRMRREVFLRILDHAQMTCFRQSKDCVGRPGFSPHQKLTCALRMLANKCSADSLDESFRMPESTAIKNLVIPLSLSIKNTTSELLQLKIWIGFYKEPGQTPQLSYHVNGTPYEFGYYLADGIYPKWATLIQSIKHLENEVEEYFSTKQEAYRKDAERVFGILQARFAIIRQPSRGWGRDLLSTIMLAA
ncbi:PREDICTED: uncharacterized protein LOC101301916 [Fragaria vesca subsp. vesca]